MDEGDIGKQRKFKSLASKLAEIMGEVQAVAKRGHNDAHNYDYATESDITAAIRERLSNRGIIVVPRVTKWSTMDKPTKSGTSILAFVDMTFTFLDGESGETLECPWLGCGQDSGDKAIYKGFTGALKYFLLKLFLIPTGDDPERNDKKPKKERQEGAGERSQPLGADAAAILTVAAELGQIIGIDPDTLVKEASYFKTKEKLDDFGKVLEESREMSFTAKDLEAGKISSVKWLKIARTNLEKQLQKEGAGAAVGSEPLPF